jgi:hypothetical protein
MVISSSTTGSKVSSTRIVAVPLSIVSFSSTDFYSQIIKSLKPIDKYALRNVS